MKIEPTQIIQEISETFDKLIEGVEPEKLSVSDKKSLMEQLDKLEELALTIKREISEMKDPTKQQGQ